MSSRLRSPRSAFLKSRPPCPRLPRAASRDEVGDSCGLVPASQAFTLIEVTLAIGIVAIAILSMVALMPVGLSTMKDASDSAITAQILNQVASTVQTTPFGADLDNLIDGNTTLFFDRSGRDVTSVDDAFFSATLAPLPTAYPGVPANVSPTSARSVEISIAVLKPGTSTALSTNKSAIIVPKS